jgi:pimeloyl-ACP methyl ester carboxylesterase
MRILPAILILFLYPQHIFAEGSDFEYPAPGRIVNVSGTKSHINCMGAGSPTVIIESGLSSYTLDWAYVQPEVSKFTRVCSYDRAGYGWSDEGVKPRTVQRIAQELEELLRDAGEKPPYILVGHSLGGVYAQYFALEHQDSVKGLVLVDSVNWKMRKMPSGKMKAFERDLKFISYLGILGSPFGITKLVHMPSSIVVQKLPAELQDEAYYLTYKQKTYRTIYDELDAMDESERMFYEKYPELKIPYVPCIVLSASLPKDYPPFMVSIGLFDHWKKMQDDLAETFAGSKHIIAEKSGHFIQLDEPELVIQAIQEIIGKVR